MISGISRWVSTRTRIWSSIALKGVAYRPVGADALLRRNLLIWGLGGVLLPFAGIKLIYEALALLGLA